MCARSRPAPATDDPAALWTPDPDSAACWDDLTPGATVTVVKRTIDGTEAARYPAVVLDDASAAPWRTLRATWVLPETRQGTLVFSPGDVLFERFSPFHPYNTFGVVSPEGDFKGWYANVTWPAFLEHTDAGLELTWQDLYLDLVCTRESIDVLDEDELDASSLPEEQPLLAKAIRDVIATMIALARDGDPPFDLPSPPTEDTASASSADTSPLIGHHNRK